jgi:hypothetical protein
LNQPDKVFIQMQDDVDESGEKFQNGPWDELRDGRKA